MVEIQGGVLRVFVDDLGEQREVCSIKCDVFRLKPEAGRVWIGFTASTAGSVHGESLASASSGQSAVSIVSWSFSGTVWSECAWMRQGVCLCLVHCRPRNQPMLNFVWMHISC